MEELLADIFTNSLLVNKLQLLKHRRLNNKTQSKYLDITIKKLYEIYTKYYLRISIKKLYGSLPQSRNECSKSTKTSYPLFKIH